MVSLFFFGVYSLKSLLLCGLRLYNYITGKTIVLLLIIYFKVYTKVTHMTKSELISLIAEDSGLTKTQAQAAFDSTITAISGCLEKGDEVMLPGLGKFEVRTRAARKGRNPQTGAEIDIAESKGVGFKTAKAMKDLLNK
jgi:nucleoid DNA-binding protein